MKRMITKEIAELNAMANSSGIEPDAKAYVQMQIAGLRLERSKYK